MPQRILRSNAHRPPILPASAVVERGGISLLQTTPLPFSKNAAPTRRAAIKSSPLHMKTNKAKHLDTGPPFTCKAQREEVASAVKELTLLCAQRPMPQDAFLREIQRIAHEHAQPCGCDLIVQHTDDGVTKLRIQTSVQKAGNPCEVCNIIECFFHQRDE